ncbi:hypothetical protein D3C87_1930260 [compost metagenome]
MSTWQTFQLESGNIAGLCAFNCILGRSMTQKYEAAWTNIVIAKYEIHDVLHIMALSQHVRDHNYFQMVTNGRTVKLEREFPHDF